MKGTTDMKNRKRWLSVILTLAMVFTLCITPAAAVGAGNENGATVTVEKVTDEYTIGSEITLGVSIAGNPGFAGYDFQVIYKTEELTLKEITQGTVTGGTFMPNVGKNKVVLANTVNLEGDGTLFTLKFTVNEAGVDGAAVSVNAVGFYNAEQARIPVDIVAGGINDTTGGSTTGGNTTGGSTTGGSTTGGSTTGGSTTGGSTTGGSTTGGSTTGGSTTGGSTTGGSTTGGSTTGGSTTGGSTTGGSTTGGGETSDEYTITFNVNGGSGTIPSQTTSGRKLSSLPTATRSGSYSFDGWYTEASGGIQITTAYVFSANTTVYAPWTDTGGSGGGSYTPSYTVSVDKTENGTITVSPKSASKGDTVTVTVRPDRGYTFDGLVVIDKNGNELKLTEKGNGQYTFIMPAGKVEIKASFIKEIETSPFTDVKIDAYYYEAVKWAQEKGITSGIGDNQFGPEQSCTRAQIVTFLWRAAGSPEPKNTVAGMADVVAGSYYEKAVMWAIENGITTGTGNNTFSPDDICTRAQAVTFLARALNAKASGAAEFGDVPADSYFAEAVAWAAANGVTTGIGGGMFGPDGSCTRGQIVTFLYRAYNK